MLFVGKLLLGESLFYYQNGSGSSDVPIITPLFMDEVNLTSMASEALITACSGDHECLFDGVVTGDIEVAIQTLTTEQTNKANSLILGSICIVHFDLFSMICLICS